MINSMTGFGRGNFDTIKRGFTVEIKSVNHRYLDINIRMPKSIISLESNIRKRIQEKVNRGKIDVFVTQTIYSKEDVVAKFNSSLADSYINCLNEIKERYTVRDDISVTSISRIPDVITLEEKEEDISVIWEVLDKALDESLESLCAMRLVEGEKLKQDIIKKTESIYNKVLTIEKMAPDVVTSYKEKLENRIKDLLENTELDENRLEMEVAVFSDKACIDEEIVRLKSHISQINETLNVNDPIGRKLDFIIQEVNREINTIGSKANNLNITKLVLEVKTEVEKIREQIQNLE
ncbi:MAG: YicC/YloC family endoribonuclease [Clostridiaceae bacterium]